MRRILAVMTAGALALCAGGCAASNQEAYEFAEHCIGLGEYDTAAEYFRQLGEYRESADYLLYAEALIALSEGDTELARANFGQVVYFKSAGRYLQCIDAMEMEAAGDYEGALEIYRSLGTFADCNRRVTRLEAEIPERERGECRDMMNEGDYAGALERLRSMEKSTETAKMIAECEAALEKAAYDEACALVEAGRTAEAIVKLEALGEVLDAPALLAACRSELYIGALKEEIMPDTLPALMETYALLGDYLDSAERLAMLQARRERNAAVAAADYVCMGSVNGDVVTWRVEAVLDGMLQLSCEAEGEIGWTQYERKIVLDEAQEHPAVQPVFDARSRSAKPFADSVAVAASGRRRTLVLIDTSGMPFTDGDGSAESPYTVK